MTQPIFKERDAPRRGTFSILALFSFVTLGLLAISVLSSNQKPKVPATGFEEVGDVDFDDAEEVRKLLTSKVRGSATGDQYL